jgi:hypothetical protein
MTRDQMAAHLALLGFEPHGCDVRQESTALMRANARLAIYTSSNDFPIPITFLPHWEDWYPVAWEQLSEIQLRALYDFVLTEPLID